MQMAHFNYQREHETKSLGGVLAFVFTCWEENW